MSTPERRHFPRTIMEKLAAIEIEPNNGGIVLNVSGKGLCFHSIFAVEKNGPVRFSLVEQNRRIAACGELAWTDKLKKVGGVRFTTLTAEAREQVQNWISQPAAALEEHESATLGSAPLKAFHRFRAHRSEVSGNSSAFAAALKMSAGTKMSGFARGLGTGLLISALGASVFLLYAHRSDIGESLIHLGERLAAKSEAQKQPAAVRAQTPEGAQSPASLQTPVRVHRSPTPTRPQIPVERPNELLSQPLTSPAKQQQPTLQPALPTYVPSQAANSAVLQYSAVRANADTAVPPPSSPSRAVPSLPVATVIPNKLSALAQPPPPSPVQVNNFSEATAVSLPQMYFELGKFKDEMGAHNFSDRVAQLGLRSRVIQKGHLWMNFFYVLVGPYGNQEEATRTEKDLVSRGYNPRPFERGSRSFTFVSALTVKGTRLPVGNFTITWESHVTDAKVNFSKGGDVLATADAQWVNRPRRYHQDEYVFVPMSNGSRLLREIHFAGLDRVLSFR